MSKKEDAVIIRLDELFKKDEQSVKKLSLKSKDKYAVFSDLHLGDGKGADNFFHNEETMKYALQYYKNNGYSLILLGDIEELWQFYFHEIYDKYNDSIYKILRSFPENKIHRVFGNHDKEWSLQDPIKNKKDIQCKAPEAIMLDDKIFLVHGHQGDTKAEKNSWFSRFVVRVFRSVEPIWRKIRNKGPDATKSQIPKEREKSYYDWAKKKKMILICGHTHRAIFASRSYYDYLIKEIEKKKNEKKEIPSNQKDEIIEISKTIKKLKKEKRKEKSRGRDINSLEPDGELIECYFNTGCGIFENGITSIEIEKDKIRLVKWKKGDSTDLEKRRKLLWNELSLSEIKKQM